MVGRRLRMKEKNKEVQLDFDGTVVEFAYPKIGRLVPHALRVIERIKNAGIRIILNTQRCEMRDNSLKEAIEFLETNGVTLDSVNRVKKILPIWEEPLDDVIFIDDIATGIPLLPDNKYQMMVDWIEVEKILEKHKII
jgi:hypothetical protein